MTEKEASYRDGNYRRPYRRRARRGHRVAPPPAPKPRAVLPGEGDLLVVYKTLESFGGLNSQTHADERVARLVGERPARRRSRADMDALPITEEMNRVASRTRA